MVLTSRTRTSGVSTGIAREVYLYARPKAHVADVRLECRLENNYQDGVLDYQVSLTGGKTRRYRFLV